MQYKLAIWTTDNKRVCQQPCIIATLESLTPSLRMLNKVITVVLTNVCTAPPPSICEHLWKNIVNLAWSHPWRLFLLCHAEMDPVHSTSARYMESWTCRCHGIAGRLRSPCMSMACQTHHTWMALACFMLPANSCQLSPFEWYTFQDNDSDKKK